MRKNMKISRKLRRNSTGEFNCSGKWSGHQSCKTAGSCDQINERKLPTVGFALRFRVLSREEHHPEATDEYDASKMKMRNGENRDNHPPCDKISRLIRVGKVTEKWGWSGWIWGNECRQTVKQDNHNETGACIIIPYLYNSKMCLWKSENF